MATPNCDRAIDDALRLGNALLKVISPNDVQSHQRGYYLPISVWDMFCDMPPRQGVNDERAVQVHWQNGLDTDSRIKWYGAAKHEYRLTRFGKDFPYLTPDCIGNLLVLTPLNLSEFHGYVFDLEDDIQDIQTALGVETLRGWGAYRRGVELLETPEECIDRNFRQFVAELTDFPTGTVFSQQTLAAIQNCVPNFSTQQPDIQLLRCMEEEYRLFRMVERLICGPQIARVFRDIDDFLKTANTILNRRKSRPCRSLENHVEQIFQSSGVRFDMRPTVEGEPDILVLGEAEYRNAAFPSAKLAIIGVKTACKDRWRQMLEEAPRASRKYILTVQRGISSRQLRLMHKAGIELVVPQPLHRTYPRDRTVPIHTLERFIASMKELAA